MNIPKPTQSGLSAKLNTGQFAAIRADVHTGKVLNADGKWAQNYELTWMIIDSLEAAKQYANADIEINRSFEWGIYDSDNKFIQRILNEKYVQETVAANRAKQAARTKK